MGKIKGRTEGLDRQLHNQLLAEIDSSRPAEGQKNSPIAPWWEGGPFSLWPFGHMR